MKYVEVPDITLQMIIEAGILKSGSKVVAVSDNNISGTINDDGSITLNINNQTKTYPFPSGAARAVTKTSVNGWIFWMVDDDGSLNDLKFYKKKYIDTHSL